MIPPVVGPADVLRKFPDQMCVLYYTMREEEGYLDTVDSRQVVLDYAPGLMREVGNIDEYYKFSLKIHPTCTVLPSVDCNMAATIHMINAAPDSIRKPIGVLQGKTVDELVECCNKIQDMVSAVALSTSAEQLKDRSSIATMLSTTKPIVIIECLSYMIPERPMSPKIRLAWSGVPYLLALEGKPLRDKAPFDRSLGSMAKPPVLLNRNQIEYQDLWTCV